MNMPNTSCPYARRNKDDVIIETVGDEIVIYDVKNQHCYSLNPTSATIWNLCDGQTTPAEMVLLLKQAHTLSDEEANAVIDSSLEQLTQAELLVDDHPHRVQSQPSVNRRTLLKALGGMISLPVISSIVMQPAIAQSSFVCVGVGCAEPCTEPNPYKCYSVTGNGTGKCNCLPVPGCAGFGVECANT